MKKIFTTLFVFLCLGITNVFAEAYVYVEPNEQSYSAPGGNSWTTGEFSGPAAQLTFEAAKSGLWAVGDIEISQLVNGEWKSLTSVMPSGDFKKYQSFGPFNLDLHATKLRFYSDGSYERYIKNLKVTMASYTNAIGASNWAPTAVVHAADDVFETTFDWCNVEPFSISISGEGASQFTYELTNNAAIGKFGTATVSATYKHNVGGVHNALLTITNGSKTYEITLQGTTNKKNQTITWSDDILSGKLPVGEEITAPAKVLSGLALTYTSSDNNVIAITNDGTAIKAIAAGQATIKAVQFGDAEWNEVADSVQITVTEKTIQFIHWIDNLTRLVVGGEPVQLTATAQILLDAETDEIQDAPERTALITYQSADDNVVTIDGTTLTIVGEGETTVTATLPGDDTYEATSISMPVRVRIPSTTCEAYVLDAPEEVFYYAYNAGSYEPAAFSGPAHILTFQARSNNSTRVGPIIFEQYVNGQWKKLDEGNPSTDWRDYRYELDRNATKVRFRNELGSYRRYFKNVLVSQATYLETTTPEITVEKSIIGDEITKTIAIQHSNIPAGVTVSNTSEHVTLSTTELNTDCGLFGEEQITLTIRPMTVGTIEDVVTIHDEVTGKALNIPVTIHTQRNTQAIIWEDSIATIYATDTVILYATAQTDVYYTSSDSAIAYVNEANQLLVQSLGTVTITAHAVESETYEPAELSKEITIVATPPVVTALPTVEPLGYGVELTNDLLVGGEANVEGTFAWNLNPEQELIPGEYDLPIQFLPANSNLYGVLDLTVHVVINKGEQTITWNDDLTGLTTNDTVYLTATAITEVYYEVSDPAIATVDGNQLTFLAAGEVTISAFAEDNEYYNMAILEKTIYVNAGLDESIVTAYPTATSITYGQTLGESQLEGGQAEVEGEFVWADGGLFLSAGKHVMPVLFVPVEQELYANVELYVEVEVLPAEQTITWELNVPVVMLLGQTMPLTATASSDLQVSYELDKEGIVSIEGEVMTALAVGTVTVTATQDGVDEDGFQNFIPAEPVSYFVQVLAEDIELGVDNISTSGNARKIIRNGQMYIIRGEQIFDALGNLIR